MKILIPHLAYTIVVKDVSKSGNSYKGSVKKDSDDQCSIYLNYKELKKPLYFPTIAHEVMHVIQFMAQDRNIDFAYEVEHGGYLINYIINEILGYKFVV